MTLTVRGIIVGVAAIATVGCASIMHGTTQKVGISSSPTGASVTVDNKALGTTPLFADLKRGEEHVVSIEIPGYEKTQLTLTKSVSGWVWGNIVFGGLIGLAVDAISGGLYNLSPEQLNAAMHKDDVDVSSRADGLLVVAVLHPDPAWRRIGNLTPHH
jgi:uncharacterized protein YceK